MAPVGRLSRLSRPSWSLFTAQTIHPALRLFSAYRGTVEKNNSHVTRHPAIMVMTIPVAGNNNDTPIPMTIRRRREKREVRQCKVLMNNDASPFSEESLATGAHRDIYAGKHRCHKPGWLPIPVIRDQHCAANHERLAGRWPQKERNPMRKGVPFFF